jgi:hypothetical protein
MGVTGGLGVPGVLSEGLTFSCLFFFHNSGNKFSRGGLPSAVLPLTKLKC